MRFTLLILMAILPCLVFATTITVKQDGSGDYTIIQAALDAANPGDTVLVYPGRYFENLTIQTNNISLFSLEATAGNPAYIDSTVIDGTGTMGGIMVSQYKTGIEVRGLSITKGIGAGISLGASSESIITNCKIFDRTSTIGGGVNVGGATVLLSGVEIFKNYALQLGGGLFASEPTGHNTNITFDPVNRCSIYDNRAGAGQDIYIQHATIDLYMPLDTFSIADPHKYHAVYLSDDPTETNYQINFDILNAHHQEISGDLYVSTIGDDNNDGLSPASALKTIHEAIYRVASDSLNQNTVHIMPGEYSRTDNDQIFPIALKSWVIVQGSGMDTTTVIGEPHPTIHENVSTIIFAANREPSIYLSDLSITARNIIRNCVAVYGPLRNSNMNLTNLRIHDILPNDAYSDNYSVVYIGATGEKESIWNNVIVENIGPADIGIIDIPLSISENGEISAFNGTFSNCTFRNVENTFTSPYVWAWPLVYVNGDKKLLFENCIFDNLSINDDDGYAIAIGAVQYPQQQNYFSFKNCLFSNISTHNDMIYVGSGNNPRIDITNCTFAGNQGDAYTLMVNGDVNITNSIFYNDSPYQLKVNPMDGNPNEHTNLIIDHSLVKDGLSGILPYPIPGNTISFLPSSISDDPLFSGGYAALDPRNYSLAPGSPCINTGTVDTLGLNLPPYDLSGNWRIWDGRIDMGCFEYGSEPWVINDDPVIPSLPDIGLVAYPNPFGSLVNLLVNLNTAVDKASRITQASIEVYNVKGQKIRSLSLDHQKVEEQFSSWDGKDSSGKNCPNGIYFLKLKVNGKGRSSKRVTLVR